MSDIRKLKWTTGIDLTGWSRDMARGQSSIDQFASSVQRQFGSIRMPAPDAAAVAPGLDVASAVAEQVAPLAASFAPIASAVRSSIAQAVAPLAGFASRFSAEFDQVGATVEKLAIRIDASMRFPLFLARAEKFRGAIRATFGVAVRDAETAVAQVRGHEADAAKFLDSFRAPKAAPGAATSHVTAPVLPPGLSDFIKRLRDATSSSTEFGQGLSRVAYAASRMGEALHGPLNLIGVGASQAVKAFVSYEKLRGALSSLGSVADATFGKLARAAMPRLAIDPRQSEVVRGIGASADRATRGFKSLGVAVAGAFGVYSASFAFVDFIKKGIVAASGLNETLSKVDVVLGGASGGVKKYADDMATQFGLVKQETLDVASGFGSLFKKSGAAGAALEGQVKQFTQLAADLSSQGNISFADAGRGLRSVLAGNESDELKKVGVFTDEATIKMYAYAHGIAKAGEELTREQKIQAAAGSVMEQSKDIQGDLANTADSTANQYRKLTGNLTNLAASIGESLMPAVNAGLGLLNKMADWAMSAFEGARGSFDGLVQGVAYGFSLISSAIDQPKAAFEVLRLVGIQSLTNLGEYVQAFAENAVNLFKYVGRNWYKLIYDAAGAIMSVVINLGKNIAALARAIFDYVANPAGGFKFNFTPLLDGFVAVSEKLPELIRPALTDLSREIGDAAKPIIDDVNRKADEAKRRAEAAKRAMAGREQMQAKAGPDKDLVNFARKITEDTRTPLEKYRQEIEKLQAAFQAKLIDPETFERGQVQALFDSGLARRENVSGKDKGYEPKFAEAAQLGSTEAYSAIIKATAGGGYSNKAEQANREKITIAREGLGLQRQILAQIRQSEIKGFVPGRRG